jgi:hypothetical protein
VFANIPDLKKEFKDGHELESGVPRYLFLKEVASDEVAFAKW